RLCGHRLAAWARRREDARRCVVPPSALLVSAELAEPGCSGKWGQPQARRRTDPLSLLLPPPPPPPPRPVRCDPRPQTPTSFRSARAPQARPGRRDGRMSGGRRKEEPPQPLLANGALKVSVWSKVLRSDAAWEDKDEFLDVIYWFRQIIAVVLGVIWGVLPLRGFLGIAGFCLINAGVLYLYFSNYLQIDEEEYGGTWELTKEGFMTSFALFMDPLSYTTETRLSGVTPATRNLEDPCFLDRESVCWASVFSARVVT
ncbi:hypothetical protein EI555_014551, partial [Monodon monoceros]